MKCSTCSKPTVAGFQFCSESCVGRFSKVLGADYERRMASLSAAIEEAARVRGELHEAQRQLADLQTRENAWRHSLQQAEAARDHAQQQIPPLQQELAQLRNALRAAEARVHDLEARLAASERDRGDLLARLKEVKPATNSAEMDDLRAKLAEAEAKLAKAQKAAMQLQARIVELEFELSEKTEI